MEKKFPKLRGRIVEKFGTIGAFAKASNIPANTVYAKISGLRAFNKTDMKIWSELLDIPVEEYYIYYF